MNLKMKYHKDRKELDEFYREWFIENEDNIEERWCRPDVYDFASKYAEKRLALFSVSNSFISVGEKEPPKHKELLVQSPDGQNYLASWREAYRIFVCQNKGEDSFHWKWKEI
ncbi:MAG: hypothetical protein Unbinned4388contig1000_48 [Prokaryotic dsDNA virus sp.]|nr:MAG: hypothetical protein Unbinned4388contig1000_48 [Prokaryotic dsDNA virus sp.]|tara:strand:- start:62951 stop:63286 length:336 start_codon:yes stop_codon:yes gene_type:complete